MDSLLLGKEVVISCEPSHLWIVFGLPEFIPFAYIYNTSISPFIIPIPILIPIPIPRTPPPSSTSQETNPCIQPNTALT